MFCVTIYYIEAKEEKMSQPGRKRRYIDNAHKQRAYRERMKNRRVRPPSLLYQQILDWIEQTNGWFSYYRLDGAVGINNSKEKALRRSVIKRLCDKGKLVKDSEINGVYRKVTPAKRIDWQASQSSQS